MKKILVFKKGSFIYIKAFIIMLVFWVLSPNLSAQQTSNDTYRPRVVANKLHSKKARVIFFNEDKSNDRNENFYVATGRHPQWFSNIKLEVQHEGGVSTRNGMFMDTGHLFLVGDWNNKGSEDIIFDFGSNLKANVREKMRLTDKGHLGLGTESPKGMLHVTGDTYSKGTIYLFAHEGDGKSGTAYLQARDKSGNSNIGLQLRSQNAGNIVNALKIIPNGNIGIGTGSPQAKLDVRGNTTIIGNTKIDGDTNINGDTSIKGDLTLSNPNRSQGFLINKGLDIRLTNIPNSHFSIQNAFGADALYIDTKGKIAIGELSNSELTEQLHVGGRIKARGFIADASSFPDYVFNKNYDLTPIEEVKTYTEIHHSLPGMPTEKEVIKNGLDLKKITTISVEKIEELYLYTFKQQKLIKRQQAKINELNDARISQQKLIQNLQDRLEKLERPK
ncbi:hypothetical protein D1818_21935 [Aquimarina sp. BL5]|uniref:hypothetical protein n=1 Tax=Aquimarina sp. BL5 TaxID=1714860 RepID=UPI000E4D282B|nr:hypothetical protein [Aquimarina sp. BL5]AXT53357.1 hypothetical protein D1818_21935 [Aquimarina sp. BL5]RKN06182.1 hypothetical protein D7036_09345 [Aquimarina sp. BL5]